MSGQLTVQRGYLRARITRVHNKLAAQDWSQVGKAYCISELTQIKDLAGAVKSADETLFEGKWETELVNDSVAQQAFLDETLVYQEKCYEVIGWLEERLLLLDAPARGNLDPMEANAVYRLSKPSALMKGPTLDLPKFKGDKSESYDKFIAEFEAVCARYKMSDHEQFCVLKQSLQGIALELINSLTLVNHSYVKAKKLLEEAFVNERVQKSNVIEGLVNLKFGFDVDPFTFYSKLQNLIERGEAVKLSVDDFYQYYIWSACNRPFQSILTQLSGENLPNLTEMLDQFFKAAERYRNNQASFKQKKSGPNVSKESCPKSFLSERKGKEVAGAVKVQESKQSQVPKKGKVEQACILCGNKAHREFVCEKYIQAQAKHARLTELSRCTRCYRSHPASQCAFQFRFPCKKCDKHGHFDTLCIAPTNVSKFPVQAKKLTSTGVTAACADNANDSGAAGSHQITSGVVVSSVDEECLAHPTMIPFPITGMGSVRDGGDSVIPTFTCESNNIVIRGMKDSGSQSSFVSRELLPQLKYLTTMPEIRIQLEGINSQKTYVTQEIELEILFGDQSHLIKALVLPNISLNIVVPQLGKLVGKIQSSGRCLADKYLNPNSSKIENLNLIIGTDYFHIFKESSVVLGGKTKSVYYDTPHGIMLTGRVGNYLKNAAWFAEGKKLCWDTEPSDFSQYTECDCSTHEPVVSCNLSSVNDKGVITDKEIQRAVDDIIDTNYQKLTYDQSNVDENRKELDDLLVKYVQDNTIQKSDGRLVMPLLWNGKVAHLLGKSRNLAEQILKSNWRKLQSKEGHLKLADDVIKEQVKRGIIEKIEDLDNYLDENPQHSFLAHMCIMKPERETTKTRIVYLSNLCGKSVQEGLVISHNQAMMPGPCLNRKLSTTLMQLRFDSKLLCFDLEKAFNQVELGELDQSKLLFLWYENIDQGNYKVVAYKNVRLCFGLKCSPTILMLALHRILIEKVEGDSDDLINLKKNLYDLFYVDNGAYSADSEQQLRTAYSSLNGIFNPYQFKLQQFVTNCESLQTDIDAELGVSTPQEVKLLGLAWDRVSDTLSTRKLELSPAANTKRKLLSTIAANFDVFSFDAPILNRARVFMHDLQCRKNLGWDTPLSGAELKEWKLIAHQVNASHSVTVDRYVGKRSDSYELLAFTDASKLMYGVVVYLKNLDTNQVSFLMSKNRIVNKQLESKTIPVLEFQSIVFGAETLLNIHVELTGPKCVIPIKVVSAKLFTDSTVSLCWIDSGVNQLEKMTKRTVFTMNKFRKLLAVCENLTITFHYCPGEINPADVVTRPVSQKSLLKSTYFKGPEFLTSEMGLHPEDAFGVQIPNPNAVPAELLELQNCQILDSAECTVASAEVVNIPKHLSHVQRLSKFSKIVTVQRLVINFVNKLKQKINVNKIHKLKVHSDSDENLDKIARNSLIIADQMEFYSDVHKFFDKPVANKRCIPNIVTMLNLVRDSDGILRVKSKMTNVDDTRGCPILLSNNSQLTQKIILEVHHKLAHAGIYVVLKELKKLFWITHYWSTVKKILNTCVKCKRFNAHAFKIPQSPYREFRTQPHAIPFRDIFIDHCGPYMVREGNQKKKVWILVITCLWSRGINLKVCNDLSVKSFLRALQLHIFEYGLPELCLSDAGSQLVAGSKVILDFLGDAETKHYLLNHGIRHLTFQQYFPGHHPLGGLVEVCVKFTKKLIYGSIGNNVLELPDFELLVAQTIHYANKRPLAFKEGLRQSDPIEVPTPITPEQLIKGHDLLTINIIPDQHPDPDPEWLANAQSYQNIVRQEDKMRKARDKLKTIYHDEFISTLISQATNERGRYIPRQGCDLNIGDVVLLKEPHAKPANYEMAIVRSLQVNESGDTTGATVFKGKTREIVNRHVTALIPLLQLKPGVDPCTDIDQTGGTNSDLAVSAEVNVRPKNRRKQFDRAKQRIKDQADNNVT